MIKVANLIEEGRLGGPQIRIIKVAERLKLLGVDTTVIFPFDDAQLFQNRLEMSEIKYLQFFLNRPTKDIRQSWKYLVFLPYEIWLLYLCFRKHKFNVVHVSGGCLHIKGIIAARLAGVKSVWHLNDTQTPFFAKLIFKLFVNKLVDGFIVAGQRVKEYYFKGLRVNINRPVIEIQAPVDCSHFDSRKVKIDKRMALCHGINIVSIGNVNPFKGIEAFLRLAKELNKDCSGLNFWMVGPIYISQSAYFKKLKKIKKEYGLNNFHFYGACQDVRPVLKGADIYLCSSVAEASPISVWEAMSMGTAIVSTDAGDVSRFIKDGQNGYIVPVGDTCLMTKRIKELIKDNKKRQTFGRLSRQTAIENLDLEICVQAHKKAYAKILNASKSAAAS